MALNLQPQRLEIIKEDAKTCFDLLGDKVQPFAGSSIVITGGSGFLGSYLVDVFLGFNAMGLSPPCSVTAIDNYSSGSRENLIHQRRNPRLRILEQDISDSLRIPEKADYIIHAASIASPVVYRKFPLETIKANVTGTWNLLEYARQQASVKSFLFLSTSEVYGDPPDRLIPTPESYWGNVNAVGPRASYDESKRLGETLCVNYFKVFGTPVKIARLFNIYGPRMSINDGRLIPDLMNDVISQRPLTLYSDGTATRSFCYVTDALCPMLEMLLSKHNGEIFNVGSNQEITVLQLAQTVSDVVPESHQVVFATHRDNEYVTDNPKRRCPDLTKISSLSSFRPLVSLTSGLRRTLSWHALDKTL